MDRDALVLRIIIKTILNLSNLLILGKVYKKLKANRAQKFLRKRRRITQFPRKNQKKIGNS